MATTTVSSADAAIPEVWARKALRSTLRDAFWSRFTGPVGSGAAVIQRTELLDGPGDVMHIPITSSLAGAGRREEQTLVGNEEVLPITNLGVCPVYYRHAVRTNHLAQQRSVIDILGE